MEIGKIIIETVCVLIALIGVILIYDARIITKKLFSFGDQNQGSKILKISGFIIVVIIGLIIMLVIKK